MKNSVTRSKADRYIKKAEASHRAGRYLEALSNAEKAQQVGRSTPLTYYWRAFSILELGRREEAYAISQAGLKAHPDQQDLMAISGRILSVMGKLQNAKAIFASCVALHPGCLDAWANYSIVLQKLGLHADAKQASLKALAIAPDNPAILANYANDLKDTGFAEEAIVVLKRAAAIAPDNKSIRSNLLFLMLLGEKTSAADLLEEAKGYAQQLAQHRLPELPIETKPQSGKIRLGILSNDLFRHACSYFLIPFIAHIDRSRFEVVLLGLHSYRDNVTHKISIYSDRFIDLANKQETEIVRAVREENFDVLIDLGGYTGSSPLHYMVYGLAPIQLTWLGYPGSTGMPTIHHRITDWIGDPAGAESQYTENLLRAPGVFAVYHPLVHSPLRAYENEYQTRETPAIRNGHVTFGSCNGIGKITDKALRLWSAVMTRCPNSRLLVEAAGLDRDEVKTPLLQRMAQVGIEVERVNCIPRLGQNQYLTYHDIDIVLDTSPVTGGTTTCDALWMGVPVVSLAGTAFHTRMSAPYLNAAGLGFLVCDNENLYANMATQLASDIDQLNDLRLSLRPRFEKSAISDAAGFARWFESQMIEVVGQQRDLSHLAPGTTDGVFCAGEWHSMAELVVTIDLLLRERRHIELRSLLENMSAKWSKHWLVAFALSEIQYQIGNRDHAIELLMESITLRKYHLPLYRLLCARMDEQGYDKSSLVDITRQELGVELALIERTGAPSISEILGVQTVNEVAA
ncbi:hypothetical protein [Cupriavidus sp. WS]|uniref:O-linked N-acetylglucosamine transferase, SPINDLY family protein n=1 Tax=Cupriavidus sp. WS TaxID=1312922 RepID=UPI00039F17AC|nr:hypothetical protein [Cupriavidus sp. WS]